MQATFNGLNLQQCVKENLEDADTNGGEDAFMEVCNNLLPTKENLQKKKKRTVQDLFCPICWLAAETMGHFIQNCPSSTDVRAECNKNIQECPRTEDDLLCLLGKLMERVEDEELELRATIAKKDLASQKYGSHTLSIQ